MITSFDWSQTILVLVTIVVSFFGGMFAMWTKTWDAEDKKEDKND